MFAIDYTELTSSTELFGLLECMSCPESDPGHTQTKPLYQVWPASLSDASSIWFAALKYFSWWLKVRMESIIVSLRFMAFGKGKQRWQW